MVNGTITLSGVVNSEVIKTVAGYRASTVPGVSKVVNKLEVQGSAPIVFQAPLNVVNSPEVQESLPKK